MKYLSLLLIVGCGPDFEQKNAIQADCLTFTTHEWSVDKEALVHNVGIAKKVLLPLVGDSFCKSFDHLQIEILPVVAWDCRPVNPACPASCTMTCTYGDALNGYIHLSRDTSALAHELLHVWDEIHGRLNPEHIGWETNGYQNAEFIYQDEFTPATLP